MNLLHLVCFACYCFHSVVGKDSSDSMSLADWRNLDRVPESKNNNKKATGGPLSRKKRFIYPTVTPWRFDIRLLLSFPVIPTNENNFIGFIPFTWNLNTLL